MALNCNNCVPASPQPARRLARHPNVAISRPPRDTDRTSSSSYDTLAHDSTEKKRLRSAIMNVAQQRRYRIAICASKLESAPDGNAVNIVASTDEASGIMRLRVVGCCIIPVQFV